MLAAKLAVYGLTGAAAGLVSALAAIAATAAWWAGRDGSFQLSGAGTWPPLGGGVGVNIAFAVIGVSVGALMRNLVAAAAALAWIALIGGVAAALVATLKRDVT